MVSKDSGLSVGSALVDDLGVRARSVEASRQTRYKIRAPITFEWEEQGGVKQIDSGLTRDISVDGLYVLSTVAPPVGTRLRLTIFFPSLGVKSGTTEWPGEGRVVRVGDTDKEGRGFGVVASLEKKLPL